MPVCPIHSVWFIDPLPFHKFKEKETMPVRIITEQEAKPRLKARGTISSNADYGLVLSHLQAVTRENKVLDVDLNLDSFTDVKPENRKKIPFTFCASLRRYFAVNGIPAQCYQSGPSSITVKRAKTAPPKPKPQKR